MKRIENIIENQLWKEAVNDIVEDEKTRIFCGHGIEHMLDVARIAYIENLEKEKGFEKEIIYAAALVHDIGRSPLYSNGLPHEEAGVAIAGRILKQAGFSDEESFLVAEAILAHRNPDTRNDAGLSGLIYRADKKSRLCLFCEARSECNWSSEKMNMKIDI